MGGSKPDCNSVQELNNCIDYCSLEDMHLSSPLLTRTNCNLGNALIESKLDRVLVNSLFFQIDLQLQGSVLNQSLSDRNPFLISEVPSSHCKTPFRYFNYWAKEAGFFSVVKESWNIEVRGTPMYRVCKKLGFVKGALTQWQGLQPNISSFLRRSIYPKDQLYEFVALIGLHCLEHWIYLYVC